MKTKVTCDFDFASVICTVQDSLVKYDVYDAEGLYQGQVSGKATDYSARTAAEAVLRM